MKYNFDVQYICFYFIHITVFQLFYREGYGRKNVIVPSVV